MKEVRIRQGNTNVGSLESVPFEISVKPYDEDVTWIHIKFKSMKKLLADYPQAFFDKHGNLTIGNAFYIAPCYLHYLGEIITFKRGTGWDSHDKRPFIEQTYLKLPEEVT